MLTIWLAILSFFIGPIRKKVELSFFFCSEKRYKYSILDRNRKWKCCSHLFFFRYFLIGQFMRNRFSKSSIPMMLLKQHVMEQQHGQNGMIFLSLILWLHCIYQWKWMNSRAAKNHSVCTYSCNRHLLKWIFILTSSNIKQSWNYWVSIEHSFWIPKYLKHLFPFLNIDLVLVVHMLNFLKPQIQFHSKTTHVLCRIQIILIHR